MTTNSIDGIKARWTAQSGAPGHAREDVDFLLLVIKELQEYIEDNEVTDDPDLSKAGDHLFVVTVAGTARSNILGVVLSRDHAHKVAKRHWDRARVGDIEFQFENGRSRETSYMSQAEFRYEITEEIIEGEFE